MVNHPYRSGHYRKRRGGYAGAHKYRAPHQRCARRPSHYLTVCGLVSALKEAATSCSNYSLNKMLWTRSASLFRQVTGSIVYLASGNTVNGINYK